MRPNAYLYSLRIYSDPDMPTAHVHEDVCMCMQQWGWVTAVVCSTAIMFVIACVAFGLGVYFARTMDRQMDIVASKKLDASLHAPPRDVLLPSTIVPVHPTHGRTGRAAVEPVRQPGVPQQYAYSGGGGY